MGNRANFGFTQSNGQTIVLYGHWAGDGMLEKLANAVDRARPRWTDESYATRIAISQLVGDDWNQELGWGLQVNSLSDNEHKIPVVNFSTQTFSLHEEDSFSNTDNPIRGVKSTPIFTMDLDTFVAKYSQPVMV